MVTKQQREAKEPKAAPPQSGPAAIDLSRFVISIMAEGKPHKLDPIGVAREAEQAEVSKEQSRLKEVRFGDHLIALAALCSSAEEFGAVIAETQKQLNWGRGRERATPRTFSVYASTIKRGMKKYSLVPLENAEIPVIEGGDLKRDEHDEVVRERVKLDGIGVFKRAINCLARAEREASRLSAEDRRSPARRSASQLHKAGFITAECEQAVSRVLWAVKHARDDKTREAITVKLNKLAAKYTPTQPFPEQAARPN
jgi:hypothetical protein